MLHLHFVPAFDFLRAEQSTFGTVYCSPGTLSDYRGCAVRQVLDRWRHQRFLGGPATYDEDRARSNDILRLGCDSVVQRAASVLSIVPTTFKRLCLMFLPWERGFVREAIRFAGVVWHRPWRARLSALADMSITKLRHPALYTSLGLLVMTVFDDPAARWPGRCQGHEEYPY